MKRRSGRLVLLLGLLILIVLIVAGYFLLTQPGGTSGILGPVATPTARPKISVLMVSRRIPAGTYISDTLYVEAFVTREYTPTGDMTGVITGRNQVIQRVTVTDLEPNEPLWKDQFAEASLSFKIPPAKRAYPVEVDHFSGIVGEIRAGDYVDVVLSGKVEEYFQQTFPLTYECQTVSEEGVCIRLVLRPFPQADIEPLVLRTVKTVMENIEVVKVITLTAEAALLPGQATPTPAPAAPGLPPGWILILAVEEPQAEILQFARDEGWVMQLLLRRRGDTGTRETSGVTTWILLDPIGPYTLPIPRAIPHPVQPGSLPVGIVP